MLWVLLALIVLDLLLTLSAYGAADRGRRELEGVKADLWKLRVSVASPSADGSADTAYASVLAALPEIRGADELAARRAKGSLLMHPDTATKLAQDSGSGTQLGDYLEGTPVVSSPAAPPEGAYFMAPPEDLQAHLKPGVTHLCPEGSRATTECCGRTVLELPWFDRLTLDKARVSCPGPSRV